MLLGGRGGVGELRGEVGVSKGREGLCEGCVADLVVADEEAVEEGLVPLAAQVAGRLGVGGLWVGEQVERLVERVADVAERLLGLGGVVLGVRDLAGESVLLGAQEVGGDRAGVVGVQQLLALLSEREQSAPLPRGFLLGLVAHAVERAVEQVADLLALAGRHADGGVEAFDGLLDSVDWHVALRAVGAFMRPMQ
jgi:hypothetical protein